MSTHNIHSWRTEETYPLIIIKYPPYLFHSTVSLWSSGNAHRLHTLSALQDGGLNLFVTHVRKPNSQCCRIAPVEL